MTSDHDELVLTVGRELHVYAIVNGSLALRRVWRFGPASKPLLRQAALLSTRDALVDRLRAGEATLIDDCEGEPRTLVRYDLNNKSPTTLIKLNPLKANKGGPCSWPVVLDASPSITVVRAQARVVAVPLIHCFTYIKWRAASTLLHRRRAVGGRRREITSLHTNRTADQIPAVARMPARRPASIYHFIALGPTRLVEVLIKGGASMR